MWMRALGALQHGLLKLKFPLTFCVFADTLPGEPADAAAGTV
jgi:hypothetical protein